MAVGNEILPNVYINNIEIYNNKINFSVMTVDSITSPKWSNKKYLNDKLKLKICCVINNRGRSSNITSGNIVIMKHDSDTEVFLLKELRKKKILTENFYFQDHEVYLKNYSLHIDETAKDITIFANVFVENPNLEGPIASEMVMNDGVLMKSSTVLLKNGEQYYGAVHRHNNQYMENAYHSGEKHSFIQETIVSNHKLKDMRKKNYQNKEYINTAPTSLFSELFVSFDENTDHNFMFFLNIKEILVKNTKFGGILKDLENDNLFEVMSRFRYRVFNVLRHKIKSYNKLTIGSRTEKDLDKIIETKNIIRASEEDRIITVKHGHKLERITYNFNDSLHGIYFEDDINDKSSGDYQYELEFIFKDPTIQVVNSYILGLNNVISQAEKYKYLLMRSGRYDHFLRTPLPAFDQSLPNLSLFVRDLVNSSSRYKSLIYKMTQEEKTEDYARLYSLLDPKSCTIESVSVFIDEIKLLMNRYIFIFDIEAGDIKPNFQKSFLPNNRYSDNTIIVKHRFKKTITPLNSAEHYVYDTTTPIQTPPKSFGKRNKQLPFKSKKNSSRLKRMLSNSINKKNKKSPLFIKMFNNVSIQKENLYTESTEYLGKDSNFNSFTTEEKCEPTVKQNEALNEIQLSVETAIPEIVQEIEEVALNKMEILMGFEESDNGIVQLKKPIWKEITDKMPQTTAIIKQIPSSDRAPDIDYPFANQYMLLNNDLTNYKGPIRAKIANSIAFFSSQFNPMLTSNNIVTNPPLPVEVVGLSYNPNTSQPTINRPAFPDNSSTSTNVSPPPQSSTVGGGSPTSMGSGMSSTTSGGGGGSSTSMSSGMSSTGGGGY